jgi:sialidase-1
MTIKASLDSGSTWLPANSLLVDERECYGYSSLVGIDEDHVGILYEGERELYFVIYSVNEIIRD